MYLSSRYQPKSKPFRLTLSLFVAALTTPQRLYAITPDDAAMQKKMMASPISESYERKARDCATNGVMLGGNDLVSYHQGKTPRKGNPQLELDHNGLKFFFSDEKNRSLFQANPKKYLPKYGGWCAITMALGSLKCPDVNNFKIEKGELLLFEITGFTNGQMLWNSDPGRFRHEADRQYGIYQQLNK